ncbi:sensor histidine kinase [hydrocarbon metagenome]|uniref:Sensor histidine kinase n=1 Tax=hydrocarbon metagenome TaxID=938273 RepID=A0A0W8FLQ7_9ZZZZ
MLPKSKKKPALLNRHKTSDGQADVSRFKLRERVKELTCLYGIAQIASNPDIPLENKLIDIVRLLPPAWQYPERAYARIAIDGHVFQTPRFQEEAHRQTATICIAGRKRGSVEIHYRDDRGFLQKNPFLNEEKNLINNIAGQIALMIEHEEAMTAKAELGKQLIEADRLAAIGQLAAGVAHELNEPLNTILGFAQLTQKKPNLSAQVLNDLEKIAEAALHARSIIKELLIFARQGKPSSARMNLNRIIMDELHLFESLCSKSGVELRRIVDPVLPEITANKSQIRQVISNLIVNALQAMPEGGILTLKTSFDASSVYLRVDDTGIGMSDEVKESIFLPFFTTKDVDQGTGLGLSVVHGIVSSHGGEISVESEKGRGSHFCVIFPRRLKKASKERLF